jgi:hypothetical protein
MLTRSKAFGWRVMDGTRMTRVGRMITDFGKLIPKAFGIGGKIER